MGRWQASLSSFESPIPSEIENSDSLSHRATSPQAEGIQAWLVSQIAQLLKIAPQEINVHDPFARYRMDSVSAIALSGKLEDWLGRPLSATLVYDYPSIDALARYLSHRNAPQSTESASSSDISPTVQRPPENEMIAIIGMGCRFPGGANDPESYWQLLRDGGDAIIEVPAARFHIEDYYEPDLDSYDKMNTRWGGFVEKIDQFDPSFFGISRREASGMDPQQRLLLEVAWEALENAAIAPEDLAGSLTGVFIGISSGDYYKSMIGIPPRAGTGIANSIAANRISYILDLCGPSIAIDTACSSSLVSVHMACQSLHTGDSDLALAGGVNLILSPEVTVALSQAGMMASDGHCKSFDAAADGYVRGEGTGIVVLKRLSDALADRIGHQIFALVRASAVNQDGRSNGLTAPTGPAQQAVIRRALERANLAPSQIDFIEAHGSGTPLGDVIEVQSLNAVLSVGRSAEQKCALGTVKANIGHLESAAGIAGLIKAVLVLQHGDIPPHPLLKEINPRINLSETPFVIPTIDSRTTIKPHFAGVSSFGFGGTTPMSSYRRRCHRAKTPYHQPRSKPNSRVRTIS
jgi:acyl transferase domain-containing protein/acyl carrier protein